MKTASLHFRIPILEIEFVINFPRKSALILPITRIILEIHLEFVGY